MTQYYKFIRLGLLTILTLGLIYEGGMKVAGMMTPQFVAWGFPVWFVYVVGGLQLLGAFGLFHHKTVGMSLFVLTVITMAAILTLAGKHDFSLQLVFAISFLLSLFGLMYLKGKQEADARWGLI